MSCILSIVGRWQPSAAQQPPLTITEPFHHSAAWQHSGSGILLFHTLMLLLYCCLRRRVTGSAAQCRWPSSCCANSFPHSSPWQHSNSSSSRRQCSAVSQTVLKGQRKLILRRWSAWSYIICRRISWSSRRQRRRWRWQARWRLAVSQLRRTLLTRRPLYMWVVCMSHHSH